VGLKDVEVLAYERRGPDVELMIEQVVGVIRCPACAGAAEVKERPVVHYVDLPVYGTPMSLAWKKHRMRCVDPACAKKSWGARRPSDRGQELLVDHQGRQVGHRPGRWRPDGLSLSIRTVESHLYSAFGKLGIRERSQLLGVLQ
jgi:hypothetical protein